MIYFRDIAFGSKKARDYAMELERRNDLLLEVVKFYASEDSYKNLIDEEYTHCLILKSDTEPKTNSDHPLLCGGKRAREVLTLIGEK